ncbi:MAG TPA: hypothetical protein VN042_10335 [Asticcacaulis sp.]|nr:hypothetical protein [Asticcacaulis sp.]
MPRHEDPQAGYASLTAIILCAALSILCTGMITLATSQARSAKRALYRAQQQEAMNTALLRTGAHIAMISGAATVTRDEAIATPQGTMTVHVRAEQEARKWPLGQIEKVDPKILADYTALSPEALGQTQNQDCRKTLFSEVGQTPPDHAFPKPVGLIASGSHDGEVWRLRAVSGNRVIEEDVRFLGDPSHIYAVVSQDEKALGESPTCRYLKTQP